MQTINDKWKQLFEVLSLSLDTGMKSLLPERDYVTFGFRCRKSVCPPSVCPLSSATLVYPTQGVVPPGNISSPLCTLATIWPPCNILWRSSQGNPSIGGVKCKRGIKIQRFWTYRRLYLI